MKGRVWSVAELIHSAPDQSGWPSAYLSLNLNLARRLFDWLGIINTAKAATRQQQATQSPTIGFIFADGLFLSATNSAAE